MKVENFTIYYDYEGLKKYVELHHHYPHLGEEPKTVDDIDKDGIFRKLKTSSLRSKYLTPISTSKSKSIRSPKTAISEFTAFKENVDKKFKTKKLAPNASKRIIEKIKTV